MNENSLIYLFLCGLGGLNSVVFSLYVYLKSGRKPIPILILILFLFISGLNLLAKSTLTLSGVEQNMVADKALYFLWLITFSIKAPIIYLFTQFSIQKERLFKAKDLLHLLPLFGIVLVNPTNNHDITDFYIVLIFFQIIAYIAVSAYLLLRKRGQFTSHSRYHFTLLVFLILAIPSIVNLIIWMVWRVAADSIFLSVIGYIFLIMELRNRFSRLDIKTQEKYRNVSISGDEIAKYYNQIVSLLLSSKLYKNPNLTVKLLSSKLAMQPYIVSLVVNQCAGTNFNDFINGFRLEEAKRMLSDRRHAKETIEFIAFECGFSTMSVFNTYFKRKCDVTPSQYRKREIPQ